MRSDRPCTKSVGNAPVPVFLREVVAKDGVEQKDVEEIFPVRINAYYQSLIKDPMGPIGRQVIPAAKKEHALVIHRLEYLPGQLAGGIAYRNRKVADGCFCPNSFGCGDGPLEELVQKKPCVAKCFGSFKGILDLSGDLRFPYDHRIKACCHLKKMTDRVFPREVIKIGSNIDL